jgi:sigma-B regulation protein RsbU (phosphoserine phosphatase)
MTQAQITPDYGFTVLIVDDDPVSVYMIENLLQSESYRTISSLEGANTYSLAEQNKPDIILLDVNMPGEQGPDICRKLKANSATLEIPVLFLSADSDVSSKVICFEAGGQDYITKPYEPREVLARVRTHLRLQQAQRTLIKVLTAQINDVARAQQVLLPPEPQQLPEANFAVNYRQLAAAGGDFFDIIKIGEDEFDYITADVCGHDIGIAFVTAAIKTILVQNCTLLHSPGEILSLANKVIPSVLQPGQYISISWVRVNRRSQKAWIVNGGQPPVLYLPQDGPPQKIDVPGDIIGVFDQVAFKQCELSVKKGDRFLLYSDGLIERNGKSPASRELGIEFLMQSCVKYHNESLTILVKDLVPDLLNGSDPDDDIVLLGVEI